MVREISAERISQAVAALFLQACVELGEQERALLALAQQQEVSPAGRDALCQLMDNQRLATQNRMAICQDTGMAVVFLDIGQDVHISGGSLAPAVDQGVRAAYRDGCFRKSVLTPLERVNTGDNTPAILHTRIVDGDAVDITVAPKGFGSENMSRLKMLTPAAGVEGVLDFIVQTVEIAGANPCPPVIAGVGIGGTMEYCALMAKRALLRPAGQPSDDPLLAELERTALTRINALGIGPQGLGGVVTALAVHILSFPTHLAGLPVAVNMQCHAARHRHMRI